MVEKNDGYVEAQDEESGGASVTQPKSDAPSAPTWPGRDATGRFQPGNLAAATHGLRASSMPPAFAGLAADLDQFLAGCIADEGDESEISTRRRALLNYRARVHRRICQIDAAIELQGLFAKDGKLRVSWLQQLQGLIATARALDSMLGLDRRQKLVSLSPTEALMQEPAHE